MSIVMYAQIKMNRQVNKEIDYISAGGYTIISEGIDYQFDFMEYAIEIDKQDSSIANIYAKNLDTDVFPQSKALTPMILSHISRFSEFFVYTGESGESDLYPEKLLACQFEITDTGEVIEVLPEACQDSLICCSI